jgi:glycogen debranching enzyme
VHRGKEKQALAVFSSGSLRVACSWQGSFKELSNSLAAGEFEVAPAKPAMFIMGEPWLPSPSQGSLALNQAGVRYEKARVKASGEWGDFLTPITNQLGHSRVFSPDTGRVSHIVSRNWCLPDGQVLFCWDSFFNGLLASVENPAAGRDTVRALLAYQLPDGMIANYSGRGWGQSADRSQPPVGSLCVWKMFQRSPDRAFLQEVYPKLLKWHRWWFTPRGPGLPPNRDGNRDGLLEWGTATGDVQNARYESGLDDSPLYDDATMSGPNMTMDSVDLSAMWAMDADYLARIAEALGFKQDAASLRLDREEMAKRINAKLWNPAIGVYCYRYWTPRRPVIALTDPNLFATSDGPGFRGRYYSG